MLPPSFTLYELTYTIAVLNSFFRRMIFISDWFATILSLAGLQDQIPAETDSFNMWPALVDGSKSPRKEIVLNIDRDNESEAWSAAIM